ncbi:50S ribosomal protein L29 [Solimonas terrae]|uniref:Large ribosomal subunit protein uL29 n=1 Tax=Solimonas terrae TaxID=1396819 RepID=A0A6M2BVQ2_9GAMM|nr:50S ribosomal protein L29 [Solimonas terrae]NGY06069.1 50S ribosomal protein L29 [Solimonas terrae]
MNNSEYVKSLRGKDAKALDEELAALRREQFNLRMQQAAGQATKPHLMRDARKKIAKVKTIARQVKAS